MDRDAKKMRGDGPTIFAAVRDGRGLDAIAEEIRRARLEALAKF
jgi:urease accessory protein